MLALAGPAACRVTSASAQEAPRVRNAPGGAVVPPGAPAGAPGTPGGPPGKPGEAPPGGQPGKPGEAPKTDAPKPTTRPDKPAAPANPEELKVVPDADGKVSFNFQGQPWLGVLEWLARISKQSLDWQEMPGDYLNLRTQRKYTVDEARDLINSHLLDRGFTLLNHGEILRVANVRKLDPSLVPRVLPKDLDSRQPHEFVKVSFALDWLIAEKAVEELKPYVSPNGTLVALKSTNRVEVKDTVANLKEIRDLLAEEQSNQGRKRLVEEFRLQHVRAADVLEYLHDILGLDKKAAKSGPLTPEQQQQQMMQMQMMRQQQQQQGGQPQPAKTKPEIHLTVNQRENSIIAHAPADQMAVIAETVKLVDVPSDKSRSLLKNASRMSSYRMAAVDPEVLVKMLEESGELDPTTRLEIDKKNRALIVNGSLADHMLIRSLVERLDGSDRRFDVIKLRRLEADYVAGTVEFMMGAGEKNKQQSNRYDPWGGYYGMRYNQPQEDESKKFRVDADVENNRLLIYANDVERAEIENLLVKLGEMPAAGGNPATMRVLETIDPEDAEKLLQRLQKTWKNFSPHELQFAPGAEPRADEAESPRPAPPRKPPLPEKTTHRIPPRPAEGALRLVDLQDDGPAAADLPFAPRALALRDEAEAAADAAVPGQTDAEAVAPAAKPGSTEDAGAVAEPPRFPRNRVASPQAPAPIRIGRGPDGRLVIASEDPAALDQFEEIVSQMAPPRRDYKVFKLKYKTTIPYYVALNLKDFFADDEKKKTNSSRYGWYWPPPPSQNEESARRLSKRRPLKFIDDLDSNSIIVIGADQPQLKIIGELIDLYDVPESKDPQSARLTRVYQVKHSKSRIIADAVKEVYRDLLSTNDPAMQNQNGKKESSSERSYTYINNWSDSTDEKKPETPVRFKGALSLGVDELSNTLIISAGEGLLMNVLETARILDEAAIPALPRMQVIQLNRNIDVNEVQKRLTKLTVKPQQPQQKNAQQKGQPQQTNAQPGGETTTVIDNN